MAMITTNPLFNNADYAANRWPIIAAFEALKSLAYQDGAKGNSGGYATIGGGFLVSANVEEILKGINLLIFASS